MNHAMPVMIAVLCLMAIAYRYYSAFLAAKVAVLDDMRADAGGAARTTGRTITRPTSGCCSATTSPPSAARGRSSGPCWRRSSGTCPGCSGSSSASASAGRCRTSSSWSPSMRRGGQVAGPDRLQRHRPRRRHRRDDRDPVHHRHRAGGAGEGRRQGAGRGGGEVPGRTALVVDRRPTSRRRSIQTTAERHGTT